MICHDRDQDLLLLSHEALPAWRRLLAEAHLRRCPRCQERFQQYQTVSRSLSLTLAAPGRPVWSAPIRPRPLAAARAQVRWALALSLLLLVAAIGVAALRTRQTATASLPPETPAACGAPALEPPKPAASAMPPHCVGCHASERQKAVSPPAAGGPLPR